MLKSVKYLDAATMLSSAQGIDDDTIEAPREHTHEEGMVGEMEGFEEAKVIDAVVEGDRVEPDEGHRIHFRLIQRPQMTTLALPSSPTWPSDVVPPHTVPWHFLPDVLSYSRFVLATPVFMLAELERELIELRREWELLKGDTLGRDFVRAARDKVERQEAKVRSELMTDTVARGERDSREAWGEAVGGERRDRERRRERERRARENEARTRRESRQDVPTEFLATQDTSFGASRLIPPNIETEPNPMPTPSRKSRRRQTTTAPVASSPPSPSYYFYQSSLGASVFLHPLDIRILLAHFKSYSLFPTTLSLRSNGFDPGTINDELRKRCKYLGHLPAGTEVIFVEAELEEIVGKEGLVPFEQPLRARREKRRARVKREDRAKSRWEKAEREKMPTVVTSQGVNDREFSLALARSTIETTWSSEVRPGLASSSAVGPSPSTSPSNQSIWGAHPQPRPSFASALHSHPSSAPVSRHEPAEGDAEVDAAWDAFGRLSVGMDGHEDFLAGGTVRESEKGGGGRKGAKKGQKKLVLGGGGGRRA